MAVVHPYLPPAEMNAAAFLADIAASNGSKIANKDYGKARGAAPYARPTYVPNFAATLKACSQCGTTRTPQWREGPEGPKTLCNACGVKRVRQMRVLADGGKRRAPLTGAAALPPKTAAALLAKQSSGSFSSDSIPAARPPKRARERSPAVPRRPQRKAAAKAASRTAEFATTGDWPDDEEDAVYTARSAGPSSRTASGTDDSAALNSDSAEEVAWTPTRGGPAGAHQQHHAAAATLPQHQQQHHGSPLMPSLFVRPAAAAPPSPFPVVGHETAAAVNLLSMSVREADLVARHVSSPPQQHQQHVAPREAAGHAQSLQQSARAPAMTFNSASFAAMVNVAALGGGGAAPALAATSACSDNGSSSLPQATSAEAAVEALQEALRALPAARHVEMLLIKEELDNAAREAAAADAAVAAVAKILAIKQAAAIRARGAASKAAKDMHAFMTGLDDEFGWSRALKRQRC